MICNLRPLKVTTIKLKTTFWTNKMREFQATTNRRRMVVIYSGFKLQMILHSKSTKSKHHVDHCLKFYHCHFSTKLIGPSINLQILKTSEIFLTFHWRMSSHALQFWSWSSLVLHWFDVSWCLHCFLLLLLHLQFLPSHTVGTSHK